MFRARVTHHPIPFDRDAGAAAIERLKPPAEVADLVFGAAGCSPYLASAMTREAAWLPQLWEMTPEDMLEAVIAEMEAGAEAKSAARVAKRRAGLLVGLAELGGVWPVMEATAAWTRFADRAVEACLAASLGRLRKPPIEGDGGLVAIAMGKMGAGELNYSSDIDLVLLFDEHRYDPSDYGAARAVLLKVARHAMALLSEINADGYVFRTDLRLRPDPGSTPIVLSMEAAERYYEAMGRTWERAAWIKARACAGDVEAGEAFIERLQPFVWRRSLDFAVVEEAFDMRRRIRDHKGLHEEWDVPGHDVKLGQGGIREIEFLTQTQQIIAGGRDPTLRVRGTLEGLDRLVAAGWVAPADRDMLAQNYRHLRAVEHRLQMVQDAQTHRIPREAEGIARLACFMGWGDAGAFADDLRERMRVVSAITEPRFRPPDQPECIREPIKGAEAITDRWATYPALRSDRARTIFARLRPGLLAALSRAVRPEEALVAFDAFLRGLPAGVQILSLFEANPRLVDLLVDICASAPDLARFLSGNAGVLDAVIAGDFLDPLPERWLSPVPVGEYESDLETLRLWHREAHFRIGVHLLRGLTTPEEAGGAYAALARAALAVAWIVAEAETVRRYGRVPGLRMAAFGMGSLGAGRLTARSDLDLVLLHDGAEAGVMSNGRRALGAGQWATKFTQVLITALSARSAAGRLYEVDMRLRPSGRQGPVAVPLSGFRTYQMNEAWVWEHMALTRARAVAGDAVLRADAEAARAEVLAGTRFSDRAVVAALGDMRARLLAAGRADRGLAVKSGLGRLQDIELAAQAHALMVGASGRDVADQLGFAGWLGEDARAVLSEAHAFMTRVRQVVELLAETAPEEAAGLGRGGAAVLARGTGVAAEAVAAQCDEQAARAAATIEASMAGMLDEGGAPG